jgi:hypothetical protein
MTFIQQSTGALASLARCCGTALAVTAAAVLVTGCGGGGEADSTASNSTSAGPVLKASLEPAATTAAAAPEQRDLCD